MKARDVIEQSIRWSKPNPVITVVPMEPEEVELVASLANRRVKRVDSLFFWDEAIGSHLIVGDQQFKIIHSQDYLRRKFKNVLNTGHGGENLGFGRQTFLTSQPPGPGQFQELNPGIYIMVFKTEQGWVVLRKVSGLDDVQSYGHPIPDLKQAIDVFLSLLKNP